MIYDITTRITYDYDNGADASRQITRLVPFDIPGEQRLVAGVQRVSPAADEWINGRDFFGNPTIELAFSHPHREIAFTVEARVERDPPVPDLSGAPLLAELGAEIDAYLGLDSWAPHHFRGSSPRVQLADATTAYARDLLASGMNTVDAVLAIGNALNRDMRYDPEATTVDTPMIESFAARHGVCQDFAHVMIACLRGVGIPAGYVSGFLRTLPPPGKPRLEGADAMHAWVRAWCGRSIGWIEFDPTNRVLAGADHIVVARGRDYADVTPIRGIMRTYGKHTTSQTVDVVPAEG